MKDELPDDMLSAYFDGEATPEECAQVERLLASSPAARQQLADFQRLSAWLHDLPREALPSEFSAQVLQRAEREMLLSGEPRMVEGSPADAIAGGQGASQFVSLQEISKTVSEKGVSEEVPRNGVAAHHDHLTSPLKGTALPFGAPAAEMATQKAVTSRQAGARWLASMVTMVASAAALILVCSQFWQSPTDGHRDRNEVARTWHSDPGAAPALAGPEAATGSAPVATTAPMAPHEVPADAPSFAAKREPQDGDRSSVKAARASDTQDLATRDQAVADHRPSAPQGSLSRKLLTASERDRESRAKAESRAAGALPSAEPQGERAKQSQDGAMLAATNELRRHPVLLKSLQDLSWLDLTAGQNVEALGHQDEGIAVVKVYVVDQNAGIHVVQTVLANNDITPMEPNGHPTSVTEFQRRYSTQRKKAEQEHQLTAVYVEATSTQLANAFKELQTTQNQKLVVDVKVEDSLDVALLSGESRQLVEQWVLPLQDQLASRGSKQDQSGRDGVRARAENSLRQDSPSEFGSKTVSSQPAGAQAAQGTTAVTPAPGSKPGSDRLAVQKTEDRKPVDPSAAPQSGALAQRAGTANSGTAAPAAPAKASVTDGKQPTRPTGDAKTDVTQKPASQVVGGAGSNAKPDFNKSQTTLADAASPAQAKSKALSLKDGPAAGPADSQTNSNPGALVSKPSAGAGAAGSSVRENQLQPSPEPRPAATEPKTGISPPALQSGRSQGAEVAQNYRARQLYLNIPSEALMQRRQEVEKLTAGTSRSTSPETDRKSNQTGKPNVEAEKAVEQNRTAPAATAAPGSQPIGQAAKPSDASLDGRPDRAGATDKSGSQNSSRGDGNAVSRPQTGVSPDKRSGESGRALRGQQAQRIVGDQRDAAPLPVQILLLIEQRPPEAAAPGATRPASPSPSPAPQSTPTPRR